MEFIKDWGIIAGVGGLALGVFLLLFREIIVKTIFPQLTKKQGFTILILCMVLVWSLSILSILIYFFQGKSNMQLTVFVTDSKGNVVLENEGRLNIPLGNRSLNERIGTSGRTNFPDITSDNKGDTIQIGLDAEGWEIIEGKNTFVFTGEPIHLKIKRDISLGTIEGTVKSWNGQDFIKGALIRINADTIIATDSLGVFKIVLPDNMRVKKETDAYLLTVSKTGYQTKTQYHYPKSSDAEIRLEK